MISSVKPLPFYPTTKLQANKLAPLPSPPKKKKKKLPKTEPYYVTMIQQDLVVVKEAEAAHFDRSCVGPGTLSASAPATPPPPLLRTPFALSSTPCSYSCLPPPEPPCSISSTGPLHSALRTASQCSTWHSLEQYHICLHTHFLNRSSPTSCSREHPEHCRSRRISRTSAGICAVSL